MPQKVMLQIKRVLVFLVRLWKVEKIVIWLEVLTE